ncbi:MAG: AraC family transcriptional regulator [Pseudomonadota bacterium]
MKPTRYAIEFEGPRWAALWASRHLDIVAIGFWCSITCFIVSSIWDLGVAEGVLTVAGTASCGFSWLLARALFRPNAEREIWPVVVVGGLVFTGLVLTLFSPYRGGTDLVGTTLGLVGSAHSLISSTVLLLAFIEPFLGFRPDLPNVERKFRLCFAVGYGGLVAISVLWLGSVPQASTAAQTSAQIELGCALMAVALSIGAWKFRHKHPLPRPKRRQRQLNAVSEEDQHLGKRILQRLEDDKLFLEPAFKLSDLARSVGYASHRVSVCITGVLGYRNFNSLINKYRIEEAKIALADASRNDQSVLMIALDCGFSSIGPFNRAFKTETGKTPTEFRSRTRIGGD